STGRVLVGLVRELGNVSVTVAPVTGLGPLFVATIVYVIEPPRSAIVVEVVFVIAKSAVGRTFVGADALSLALFGSGVRGPLEPAVFRLTLLQRSTPAG